MKPALLLQRQGDMSGIREWGVGGTRYRLSSHRVCSGSAKRITQRSSANILRRNQCSILEYSFESRGASPQSRSFDPHLVSIASLRVIVLSAREQHPPPALSQPVLLSLPTSHVMARRPIRTSYCAGSQTTSQLFPPLLFPLTPAAVEIKVSSHLHAHRALP